jgi:hypothetical protein
MIPVTQTKVVVKNSKEEIVSHGNCYAAAIASMIDLPLWEVPNVEVFFHMPLESTYWQEVMLTFLESKGFELCCDDRFRVFHDGTYGIDKGMRAEWVAECKDKYYLVSGKSPRGFSHMVIYKNGRLAHDPHPSRDGVTTIDTIQTITFKTP